MSESNITTYVNSLSTLLKSARCSFKVKQLRMSHFSSILIVPPIFHVDCSKWCRFTFLTCVGKNSQCCCGNYIGRVNVIIVVSPYTWMIAWMTSLSACIQYKKITARDHVCHIALNRTLLRKFEKSCNFSSHVKTTSRKKKPRKKRPACVHPVCT
jgi:hypothetical protein